MIFAALILYFTNGTGVEGSPPRKSDHCKKEIVSPSEIHSIVPWMSVR